MDGRGTTTTASSRAALRRAAAGEIVQVQGGHILRSTGRKDRHSKVCTAKGPRDRRVRLSAHTAIQFYDVQDRLGYDRPSKAVDWLITKAKAAIDKLDELPAWKPTTAGAVITTQEQEEPKSSQEAEAAVATPTATAGGEAGESSRTAALSSRERSDGMYAMNKAGNSVLLLPSMDSGSIVDTIKSFFPTAGTGSATHHGHVDSAVSAVAGTTIPVEGGGAQSLHFQSYQLQDLLTQRGQISQDLKLSLQSFREPAGGFQSQHQSPQQQSSHHNNHHHHNQQQEETQQHSLFQGVNSMGFESPSSTTGWAENHQPEIGRLQRLVGWNLAGGFGDPGGASGGGFLFMQPQQPLLQPLFGHGVGGGHGVVYNSNSIDNVSNATTSHLFSQRGPLQSNNNTPLVRTWTGENWMANAAAGTTAANNGSGRGSGNHQNDTHHHQVHHEAAVSVHPISLSRIGFTSTGAFPGFHIPARIQGSDEEEHDSNVNKLSSASPNSRH